MNPKEIIEKQNKELREWLRSVIWEPNDGEQKISEMQREMLKKRELERWIQKNKK